VQRHTCSALGYEVEHGKRAGVNWSGRDARVVVVSFVIVAGALVASCSTHHTTAGADPGNARLHLLASDPVFQSLPSDIHTDGLRQTPARYAQPGFGAGGWHGPAVTLMFTSAASPASVFADFARHARASGWTATASRNALGYPQVWTKRYSGRSPADLTLTDLDLRTSMSGKPSRYVVNASA
jgi:hypothetical protein